MAILGLTVTESDSSWRNLNARRRVFYQYPQGAAPLMGILSLMQTEETNDPKYSWWEKRKLEQNSTTKLISSGNGPFGGNAAGTLTWGSTLRTSGGGIETGGASAVGDKISVYVNDTTHYRVGHVVVIDSVTIHGTSVKERIVLRVCGFNASSGTTSSTNPATAGYLDCLFLKATSAGIDNSSSTANNDLTVMIVGSSFGQGDVVTSTGLLTISGQTVSQPSYELPKEIGNYTQIFRTPFSFAGTAIKTALKFDESGPYKDKAKDAQYNHMVEMEKAFLFGQKAVCANGGGTSYGGTVGTLPLYNMGGVIYFLQQWEAGTDYGITWTGTMNDAHDGKRIIANTGGYITDKLLNTYYERLFRYTSNTTGEKLCLCGSGYLSVLNQMYKAQSCLDASIPMKETFGMKVVSHVTPFGTIYYKTHPLFNQNAGLRSSGLYLDVPNMRYRYITGRDTDLLSNRQPNNADYREDEYLTECGLEYRYPESSMFIQNVLDFMP